MSLKCANFIVRLRHRLGVCSWNWQNRSDFSSSTTQPLPWKKKIYKSSKWKHAKRLKCWWDIEFHHRLYALSVTSERGDGNFKWRSNSMENRWDPWPALRWAIDVAARKKKANTQQFRSTIFPVGIIKYSRSRDNYFNNRSSDWESEWAVYRTFKLHDQKSRDH